MLRSRLRYSNSLNNTQTHFCIPVEYGYKPENQIEQHFCVYAHANPRPTLRARMVLSNKKTMRTVLSL